MNQVVAKPEKLSMLADIFSRAASSMKALVVALYKNDLTPDENTPLSAFTEADFTGYARLTAVNYTGIFYDAAGTPYATTDILLFRPTAVIVGGQPIYGLYVLNTAADTLMLSWRFPQPINVLDTFTPVRSVLEFRLADMPG